MRSALKAALTRVFNDYARKYNILKEKDQNLTGEDVREGLTAVISVKVVEAQFEGQTKTKLGNSEIRGLVDKAVSDKFAAYLEENPAVAKMILEKSLTASRAREAARKAREATRKSSTLGDSSLLGKLALLGQRPGKRTRFILSRVTRRAALPNRAETEAFRRFCRFGARCSTLKKRGLIKYMATKAAADYYVAGDRDWR